MSLSQNNVCTNYCDITNGINKESGQQFGLGMVKNLISVSLSTLPGCGCGLWYSTDLNSIIIHYCFIVILLPQQHTPYMFIHLCRAVLKAIHAGMGLIPIFYVVFYQTLQHEHLICIYLTTLVILLINN